MDLTHFILFYVTRPDITQLARAAVSGDESALDMFSWKAGKSSKMAQSFGGQESLSFFVGGASGKSIIL